MVFGSFLAFPFPSFLAEMLGLTFFLGGSSSESEIVSGSDWIWVLDFDVDLEEDSFGDSSVSDWVLAELEE